MDDPLEKLIGHLRSEKCPSSVLGRVQQRIQQDVDRRRVGWIAWTTRMGGMFVAVVLGAWLVRQVGPRPEPVPDQAAQSVPDRRQVLEQTQGALVVIGQVLLRAGAQVESSLADEAVPPVLKSFHTAKDKLKQSL